MGLRQALLRLLGDPERREARRLLRELFRSPERLRGTSLRPEHAGRAMLLRHEAEGGRLARLEFGLLRHPRPYAFSSQVHEVVEVWAYDVASGRLERRGGVNLSRLRGTDGEPGAGR